jgi:PAS domain S-box-containing protein
MAAAAALIGFVSAISFAQNVWILYAVLLILCMGIVLIGGQIRATRFKEQSNLVEEQLSVAEARFQAFFNDPVVGIGILGLDRRLIDANHTFCHIFGRTREELIGMNAAEVTYPDDDPASAKLFADLLAGQRDSYKADRRYIRKNGEVFWAHMTMSMVRGSDNQPRYLVGMVLDVDNQKRNALALEESEARFRAAFESSAIGMALTTINGHFLKANAAVRKMSGYTEEELEQLSSDEIVFPDDKSVGLDLFTEMMEGKRSSYQVERRYVRKNREVFWTRLTLSAVHDTQGNIAYLVALVEDIDEQKRTSTELKKSEARFQAVFENAAVGISLISLDGKILANNPVIEKIFGYSETDLRQTNPVDLMFAEDRAEEAGLYQELLDGKRSSYVSEMRYHRKDGGLYWIRVNYSGTRSRWQARLPDRVDRKY